MLGQYRGPLILLCLLLLLSAFICLSFPYWLYIWYVHERTVRANSQHRDGGNPPNAFADSTGS
jgi:hypothetical protein